MAFDFVYPTPLPSTKGWGPGWPDCQLDKREPHDIFAGGVHRRIHELVSILCEYMKERGFRFMSPGCWGWGCRATKGSTGDTPSFHSWGLGIDINAPQNVFGAPRETSDIATNNFWVVGLMREFGFFWLGPDIKDWMHFSFCGSPEDADRMTVKARNLMKDQRFDEFLAGWRDHRQGDPEPETNAFRQAGWNFRREAVSLPHQQSPAEHDHPHDHAVPGGTGEARPTEA